MAEFGKEEIQQIIKGWHYYQPDFLCDREDEIHCRFGPWAGLRPFAYDYIRNIRPQTIVELGTHWGCSAFAMLQAVQDGGTGGSFTAVDTWEGDDFTRSDYADPRLHIEESYERIRSICYGQVKTRTLKMTFSQAAGLFPDESIDLLHIDGSHHEKDVERDYLQWKPKVKKDGVIWIHDVGEELFEGRRMGAARFWDRLRSTCPYTLTLPISCGLGLVFGRQEDWAYISEEVDQEIYAHQICLENTQTKARVRELYHALCDAREYQDYLIRQLHELAE